MDGLGSDFGSSAPTKYNFGRTARITITNPKPVHYTQVSRDAHVIVLKQVDPPHLPETFLQEDIRRLKDAGKLSVDPHHFDVGKQRIAKLNPGIETSRDLPAEEVDTLDFYRRLVHCVDQMRKAGEASLSDRKLEVAIARAYGELVGARTGAHEGRLAARQRTSVPNMPRPSTFRAWRRKLIKLGDDLIALRDGRKGRAVTRKRRITDPVSLDRLSFWVRAFLDSNNPSMRGLHLKMVDQLKVLNKERLEKGLPEHRIPSLSTFERAIEKLDPHQVTLARDGHSEARRGFKIAARRTGAVGAGDRVAIDNWRTNLMSLKLPNQFWDGVDVELRHKLVKLRFNLCVAICEASKIVLGARLSVNPTTETSLRTLEMVCRNKNAIAIAAGCRSTWDHELTPFAVPADSGNEFIDVDFRAAVRDLGATNEVGPAGHPDVRPYIERFFGTLDVQLMQHFTGRTGRNVLDKGDYDPKAMASVTLDVLTKALVRWIVDVYHNSPHGGLGGETPNDAWERLNRTYGVQPSPSPARMRAIFGFSDKRRIGNRGIRFLGLFYKSRALAELRTRIGQGDIQMRADMQDLGRISVRDLQHDGPWFSVPCEVEGFAGVSADEWIAATRALRLKHAKAAKLREDDVLQALRDIRALGLKAAEEAGIGPTTLLSNTLKELEVELFRSFEIVVAATRGRALEGIFDDVPDAPAGTEPTPEPATLEEPASPARPSTSVGRRRRGSSFLLED